MELCELLASEFYKSKKETGADLFKMFPKEKTFFTGFRFNIYIDVWIFQILNI